jgi:predicted alpha/beta-fold hydrolase
MVQGSLVRWTTRAPAAGPPPTAVLLHGILGSRRNLSSLARMLVQVRGRVTPACANGIWRSC